MRKYIYSLLILFALGTPMRAELLIYKEVESGFIVAAPGRANITVRGFWAYDSVSGLMSEIGITTLGNTRYYIINTNFGVHSITRVATPPREQLVISRAYSSNTAEGLRMSSMFVKGPVFALPTGTGGTVAFARSLKGPTRTINSVLGQPAFAESNITMVFSAAETKKANELGESVADFLERWRTEYEGRGYVPLPTE